MSDGSPTKVGAGLLICCEGSCLLLRRSESSGNPGSWGLPGGNADEADRGDLLGTAMREAREEVGQLPEGLHVLGQVLTRRGKALQKHYTVFVASIPGSSRARYAPQLNDEHTDWRWVDLAHVAALAGGVHPHAHLLPAAAAQQDDGEASAGGGGDGGAPGSSNNNSNGAAPDPHQHHGHHHHHHHSHSHGHGHGSHGDGGVAAELAAGAAAAAGPPPGGMTLHPVVRILFGGAHTEALAAMLPPSVGSPVKAPPPPA
ncbi:hypothetical protein HYH02_013791 [Chlamydomonas schloesseri]|uniref:Nudix hydrolase domain-containing protein n=1 Tax=Chlamydomonas schloesseri TaxID=2026947 RepID=A0A835SNK5_9CHLO|nr:hypothetical protein HYH02_013791 [Chlamydomonas schloesseri]|eukprot:KAG2430314.1 hypothetical protein HYH02_013791 [Chlamydomonas schloesseri]